MSLELLSLKRKKRPLEKRKTKNNLMNRDGFC